jgi:hypothetical protein
MPETVAEYDRTRHGFDSQEGNVINCPNDKMAPWSWGAESLIADGSVPPYCPACGERVEAWLYAGEFSHDPVLVLKSRADGSQTVVEDSV